MILPIVFFTEYWLKLCEDSILKLGNYFTIKQLGVMPFHPLSEIYLSKAQRTNQNVYRNEFK